jgi:hypothetical protein
VATTANGISGEEMKKGDLIKMSDGRMVTAVSEKYTHRFMDAEDHDMVSHGMGEYAGSYGGAIDVMCMETGRTQRLRFSNRNFKVISE